MNAIVIELSASKLDKGQATLETIVDVSIELMNGKILEGVCSCTMANDQSTKVYLFHTTCLTGQGLLMV
jgi:hypothetical protein